MTKNISTQILSDITIFNKYAKYIPELGRRETWEELCDRNAAMHIKKYPMLADEIKAVYDNYVVTKKVLPSMRSMQFAGKPIELAPNRIYNCAFVPIDDYRAFSEIMFLLLGGTGMGYSVQRHHVAKLPPVKKPVKKRRYVVGDSIEGWSDAVKALISAYLCNKHLPIFDFSDIRPKGAMLVTSGGKAPGPEPLKDCLHNLQKILDRRQDGEQLTTLEVHDMVCYIADAVLAGGIRRAALIAIFNIDDEDMLTCKFGNWWELNPQRARANNSAVVLRHKVKKKDFMALWDKVKASGSGEPGIVFSNNAEWGLNPCAEISLRPGQLCNLVEINMSDIESQEDLNGRAKAASFIATLQAGYTDFHYLRDFWKKTTEKDALLGVSGTGIASDAYLKCNLTEAVDAVISENSRVAAAIGINSAARQTTNKPSGCVTLDTEIVTSLGIHSLKEIFEINNYNFDNLNNIEKTFLPIQKHISIKDENNQWQPISKLYVNEISEITYKIEFDDGVTVTVTPNHKFKTSNRGWVRADELTINDDLINLNK